MPRLYLAQSVPDGWGGVARTSNAMKLHLAERDPQHHAWAKRGADRQQLRLRILLSYWYYKDTDLDELMQKYFTEPYPDIFADSGGFSADSQGVTITTQEYTEWIKRWAHWFSIYANLDVIGQQEPTWQNQMDLENKGLTPLPVLTAESKGGDYEHLEMLVEKYPYIALGGIVPYMGRPKLLMPHLIRCFKIAGDKAVFHGFGVTNWTILKALPWYSTDSSSWGMGFRYGRVPLFDTKRGKFEAIDLGDTETCYRHASLIHSLGFDPADFADRERNDRAKICAISALSYMLAEQWLRQRHGEVRIPSRDGAGAGPRLHLADANPNRYKEAIEGASGDRLHLSDTSSGINFGDADKGVKLHLADARGHNDGGINKK